MEVDCEVPGDFDKDSPAKRVAVVEREEVSKVGGNSAAGLLSRACDAASTGPGSRQRREMSAEKGQAQYGIATAASKLDCVQIDGLVVLKIIKHSRDEGNPNEMVSGQLLGMDITQNDTTTLEVSVMVEQSCQPTMADALVRPRFARLLGGLGQFMGVTRALSRG